MKTLAAVLVETARPLELAELEIPPLKAGQVLVEVIYSGVCHSQINEWQGLRGPDKFLPHCLGHEGSGRVLEIGAEVTRCRPGDDVILSWIKGAGLEVSGSVYGWGNRRVNAGAVTTFSQHSVVSENRVTVNRSGVASRAAALVGCAVATGFGSVIHAAGFAAGENLAVLGAGGIGLCAIMAGSLCGASRLTAVDVRPRSLELAAALGAAHVVDARSASVMEALREICPAGFDAAVEATGQPEIMRMALAAVRPRGGRAVIVGNAPFGQTLNLDPHEFNQGKRLLGTWGGDTIPDRDFPQYCDWLASGQAPVERIIDAEYSLADINVALHDLQTGRATRPLIRMN